MLFGFCMSKHLFSIVFLLLPFEPGVPPSACGAGAVWNNAFFTIHYLSVFSTWIKGREVELEWFLFQVQLPRSVKDQSTAKPTRRSRSFSYIQQHWTQNKNLDWSSRHYLSCTWLPCSPAGVDTVKHVNTKGTAHNQVHLHHSQAHWTSGWRRHLVANSHQVARCSWW